MIPGEETSEQPRTPAPGCVYLVGAGPGDPGLITVRGLECLREADCVVYDRLVHPGLLAEARSGSERAYVGKAASHHALPQESINRLLIDRARAGQVVCRLKGGDPFVFGRGGEEAEALAAAGVPFEVVPGVTAAVAVPAYAGIPVTHRSLCSALGIFTGHENLQKARPTLRWASLADGLDTLVFLMGVQNLPNIVEQLIAGGRPSDTPVAVIRWGTRPNQQTITGTLADIGERVREARLTAPAVTVVGDVVRLRDRLRWYDNRALFGKRVLSTRSREQAPDLSRRLERLGAEVVAFPTIRIVPISDTRFPLSELPAYDWLIFTSANGVRAFFDRLFASGADVRALGTAQIAAIGPATAAALEALHLRVAFRPSRNVAECLLEEFPENPDGRRILIPRAEEAREVLPKGLRAGGGSVDVLPIYRTLPADGEQAAAIRKDLEAGRIDAVTFTSSSTARSFVDLVGPAAARRAPAACIGPVTAATARDMGLRVVAEPETDYSIPGLVAALEAWFSTHPP